MCSWCSDANRKTVLDLISVVKVRSHYRAELRQNGHSSDKKARKGHSASSSLARSCSLSLSSSSRKHLSHFCPALPAASHTVSLDFPQEHSEGSRFIGTQEGTEVAWLSGSISCTSHRPRQKTYSPPIRVAVPSYLILISF